MYATDVLADPADVFAFAWSAPMRELAARVGISDVGLRKLLRERGIVIPPQGHWNRVHAGRQVVAPPSPSPRKPGGSGRIRLDARFRDVIPNVGRWPVDGPFASAAVPEALDDLRAQILASTPKVAVPRLAARPHQGLAALLRGEIAREAKHSASGWQWDAPRFASPFWLRQLRLYNSLYHGLDRHEAGGALSNHDAELHARVRVCDTVLSLTLVPLARHRRKRVAGHERPADDLPASTPLRLTIGSGDDAPVYEDAVDNRLEVQLRAIVADVVVAGEAAFRRGLREQRDWDLQMGRLREEERQRRLAIEEAARSRHLAEQAAALREADDIRALVARVRASPANADPAKLAAWCNWAQTRADRLDPVLSGSLVAGLDDPAA